MIIELFKIDWVTIGAIVSLLGVIATVIMIYYTRRSLIASQRQLEELKRQWHEEHKPRLLVDIVHYNGYLCLKLENIGKGVIRNLAITFNEEFIDCMVPISWPKIRQNLQAFQEKRITLPPAAVKFYALTFEMINYDRIIPCSLLLDIVYDGQQPYKEEIDINSRLTHEMRQKETFMIETLKEISKVIKGLGGK